MENFVDKALMIACNAHAGQIDKGGNPYILHPLRLALQFSEIDCQIVALLHDVIEDSEVTLIDLQGFGFSKRIIEAVDTLTKKPEESYDDFINRISENNLASQIKIADLKDNMDINRLSDLKEEDFQRLKKYRKAIVFLSTASGRQALSS